MSHYKILEKLALEPCYLNRFSPAADRHAVLQFGYPGRLEQVFDSKGGLQVEFRKAEESALVWHLRRQ